MKNSNITIAAASNFTERRAAAEGFSVAGLKVAAARVQASEEADAERFTGYQASVAPLQFTSLAEMAARVAKSENYRGGYIYPGTCFSHGLDSMQPHAWTRPGDSTEAAPLLQIEAALASIPVGDTFEELTNFSGKKRVDYYKRTAVGFYHIGCSDESSDEFFSRQNYVTPQLVAKELGVACSHTLVTMFYKYL